MSDRVNLLTPVGRLIGGNLYKGSAKDADGNPLTFKSGANQGQPRLNYYLKLAVPKGSEKSWSQTEWGNLIYSVGAAAFPAAHKTLAFSWKIEDGDSQELNSRGKRTCDQEGAPGNWIIRFSGSFAPKVYREENGAYVQVTEPDYIKAGYYVQIAGTVCGNRSQQSPGLYLNHSMVAFIAYGQEIHFGPDANSVGFGQSSLPAGASTIPLESGLPLPVAPAVLAPRDTASVTPNHEFVQCVPPPPAPSTPKMTAKAAGASYRSFKTAGWTDEAMVAEGYLA